MTRLMVILKYDSRLHADRKDEVVMTLEHNESWRNGATVGPFTVAADGSVLFWPGQPHVGEPVPIGPDMQMVVTCEVDDK